MTDLAVREIEQGGVEDGGVEKHRFVFLVDFVVLYQCMISRLELLI